MKATKTCKVSALNSVLRAVRSFDTYRITEQRIINDIDLENQILTVSKTHVYLTTSTTYLSTPKSKASLRTIRLDEMTVRLLKKHRINRNEMYLRYPSYKKPETNIVFHQQDVRWLRTNVVGEYFKEVCKRAGLPVLSPHALRHSHAVHLLEAGICVRAIRAYQHKNNR